MKSEWIPATQPPTDGKQVLVYWAAQRHQWDEPRIMIGEYHPTLKCWRPLGYNGNYNEEISHWMPLPEPPKC